MKSQFSVLTVLVFLIAQPLAHSADKSVIVGFRHHPRNSEKAVIHGAKGIIKRTFNLIPAMVVTIPEEEIPDLFNNSTITYIQENVAYRASDEYVESWGVGHIGANQAHISGNKGAGIKIAVIDTGIDYNHQDLDDNYAGGWNCISNNADPFDDSDNSHGTHVAGIIAAEENGIGTIGVAPEAEIYAVKVLDEAGNGTLESVIAGVQWAANNEMDIANLSLEGPNVPALQDACHAAYYNAGVLLVAAGGNTNGGAVRYPGGYTTVIAVTATNAMDQRASFSPIGSALELAAPGLSIFSTISGGGYGFISGTSQASPHVAGTAALFFLTNPVDENSNGFIHDEVRELLQITAIDLGEPDRDTVFGFGLVNASPQYACNCEGNFDGDSDVDGSDGIVFKDDFGRSHFSNPCEAVNPCNGDFDCDGDVDGNDASIFRDDFGRSPFNNPCLPDCDLEQCNYGGAL
jgi:subtilisin